MAFKYPIFDVQVERNLKPEHLSWAEPGEAMDDMGLGSNRLYMDLRRLTWSEARRVYEVEGDFIERIVGAMNPEDEYEEIENDDSDQIFGLDTGVASTVVALSSAGCIPFASCNAGTFGGSHNEQYPLVAFYMRAEMKNILLEAAEESGTGLENSHNGSVVVYADDIRKMRTFAASLSRRSSAFRKVRLINGKTKHSKKDVKHEQLLLF